VGSLIAQSCARQHHIEFVPLVRLIATPEPYLNREVATVGFLYLGAHPRLSVSQDDETNGRFNGIRTDFPREFYRDDVPSFANKNVLVEGALQSSEPADLMPVMRIDRLLIWPVAGPEPPPGTYWRRSTPG
jgi:hypothetical protein